MLIGGAEDKVRDKLILSRFATFAGGPDGHVAVIATASSLGDVATERYRELFEGLGIGRVTGLRPEERSEAEAPELAAALHDATAIFLTGGNQLRLSSVVAGTHLADAIHRAHDRGAVLAGDVRRRERDGDAHDGVRPCGRDPQATDGTARRRARRAAGRRDRPTLRAARPVRQAAGRDRAVAVVARHRSGRGHERDRLRRIERWRSSARAP
jgi:hypothetical protein